MTKEIIEFLRREGSHVDGACAQEKEWCRKMNAAADRIEELEGKKGRLPDRECFWLVERKVSPPQYVGPGAGWTDDAWRATRFNTERAAHDHWRTMNIFRDESRVVEHMFINKP